MEAELLTGARGSYCMLEWNSGCDVNLGAFLRQFPQIVMGRYVAIAWSDSAKYTLSAAEIDLCWQCVGDLAFSPLITDIAQLPTPGFDALLAACPSLILITRDEEIYERTLALYSASAIPDGV